MNFDIQYNVEQKKNTLSSNLFFKILTDKDEIKSQKTGIAKYYAKEVLQKMYLRISKLAKLFRMSQKQCS